MFLNRGKVQPQCTTRHGLSKTRRGNANRERDGKATGRMGVMQGRKASQGLCCRHGSDEEENQRDGKLQFCLHRRRRRRHLLLSTKMTEK